MYWYCKIRATAPVRGGALSLRPENQPINDWPVADQCLIQLTLTLILNTAKSGLRAKSRLPGTGGAGQGIEYLKGASVLDYLF